MDLEELNEIFDDNDEDIIDFVMNMRTYTVQERKDYFVDLDDKEFFRRFRLKKDTVNNLLRELEPHLHNDNTQ